MSIDRPRSLRVPLSDEELHMAHALAEHEGMSATMLVRRYIRKAYAKLIVGGQAGKGAK